MSSMKRRIFMGKAKSVKSNVLKIVSIVAAILVAVGIIAVFVAPLIPVRKVDESAYKKLDNNDVYERAYNIYGVQIYKDRDKALAQFKPETPNGYKFEKLVLDMVEMMDNCVPYEVERNYEFAPIKNKTGKDSLESARELLKVNGIEF